MIFMKKMYYRNMESKFHMKQIMVEQNMKVPKDEFEEVIKDLFTI